MLTGSTLTGSMSLGFLLGGYTALATAVTMIDISVRARLCSTNPQEFTCADDVDDIFAPAGLYPRLRVVTGDPRIAAVGVAAPGFSFSFDREALVDLLIPVQIWAGALAEWVPPEANGALLAELRCGGNRRLQSSKG